MPPNIMFRSLARTATLDQLTLRCGRFSMPQSWLSLATLSPFMPEFTANESIHPGEVSPTVGGSPIRQLPERRWKSRGRRLSRSGPRWKEMFGRQLFRTGSSVPSIPIRMRIFGDCYRAVNGRTNHTGCVYVNTIKRAIDKGWSKENIGHHIVRNNEIFKCGQVGIVGSL